MEIKRTINFAGLKTTGGGDIPSTFFYVGVVTGIDTLNHQVGFSGVCKANEAEEEGLIIKGSQAGRGGYIPNIGGTVAGACTCSEDKTTHVIDKEALLVKVDEIIAARLGCEVSDIS